MEVRIDLSYPSLKFASDRTFTDATKSARKIVKKIQRAELDYIVGQLPLKQERISSIRDRIELEKEELASRSVFYIDHVTRGSFLFGTILSGAAILVLKPIIESVVKKADERHRASTKIVKYLEGKKLEYSKRWRFLGEQFRTHLGEGTRVGRFEVMELAIARARNNRDMSVRIVFELAEEFLHIDPKQFDTARTIKQFASIRRMNRKNR